MFRQLLIVGLLLVMVMVTVSAQDSELTDQDLELVTYISQAFARLNTVETYTISGEQTSVLDIAAPLTEGRTGTEQASVHLMHVRVSPGGIVVGMRGAVQLELAITTDASSPEIKAIFLLDYIFLDNHFYVRRSIESDAPEIVRSDYDGLWLDIDMVDLLGEEADVIDGVLQIDIAAFTRPGRTQILTVLPVNESSVQTITEMESLTENGQVYRVFQVTHEPVGLIPENVSELLDTIEEYRQAFETDMTDYGIPDSPLIPNVIADTETLLETIEIEQQIWIHAQDQVPYRVIVRQNFDAIYSALINMFGYESEISPIYMTTEDMMYTNINEPFDLTLPEDVIPIPAAEWAGIE